MNVLGPVRRGAVAGGIGTPAMDLLSKRYLDWDLPDPKGRSIDDVRATRDEIARRVEDLIAELDTPNPPSG